MENWGSVHFCDYRNNLLSLLLYLVFLGRNKKKNQNKEDFQQWGLSLERDGFWIHQLRVSDRLDISCTWCLVDWLNHFILYLYFFFFKKKKKKKKNKTTNFSCFFLLSMPPFWCNNHSTKGSFLLFLCFHNTFVWPKEKKYLNSFGCCWHYCKQKRKWTGKGSSRVPTRWTVAQSPIVVSIAAEL